MNLVTGKLQMEQILGGTTGLWETADPTLHAWTLVNASFYPTRAGGGGIFFPLPKSSSSSAAATANSAGAGYTYMLNEGSACHNFVLGNFDAATSTFTPAPASQPRVSIDEGDVMFSEVCVDRFRRTGSCCSTSALHAIRLCLRMCAPRQHARMHGCRR